MKVSCLWTVQDLDQSKVLDMERPKIILAQGLVTVGKVGKQTMAKVESHTILSTPHGCMAVVEVMAEE